MVELALIATDSTYLKVEWDTTKSNGQHRKDVSIEKLKFLQEQSNKLTEDGNGKLSEDEKNELKS